MRQMWSRNEQNQGLASRSELPSSAESLDAEAFIEDYLDHVFVELIGTVPYARRMELRSEMRGHLLCMVDAHLELGSEPDEALRHTLRQFGEAREVGRQWATEWFPASQHPLTGLWRAFKDAMPWALAASSLLWFVVLRDTPDHLLHVAVAAPLIAGFMAGQATRRSRPVAAVLAFSACSLLSFILAHLSAWGAEEMVFFDRAGAALVQFVFWIPLGGLGAFAGRWFRHRCGGVGRFLTS